MNEEWNSDAGLYEGVTYALPAAALCGAAAWHGRHPPPQKGDTMNKHLISGPTLAFALAFALAFTLAFTLGCAQAAEIAQLGWLSGHWQQRKGALDTEEHWIAPKGGTMMAINRSTKEGRTVEFEFLRIVERDGRLIYVASPYGRPPVEFPAVSVDAARVVFENPGHDFPTRIIYTAESADVLVARVEGQGRSMEWRLLRMK